MIKRILVYFAKRTHDVRLQLLLACLYGLVHLYGVTGGFAIILKARKLQQRKRKTTTTEIPKQ